MARIGNPLLVGCLEEKNIKRRPKIMKGSQQPLFCKLMVSKIFLRTYQREPVRHFALWRQQPGPHRRPAAPASRPRPPGRPAHSIQTTLSNFANRQTDHNIGCTPIIITARQYSALSLRGNTPYSWGNYVSKLYLLETVMFCHSLKAKYTSVFKCMINSI